jgi:hypothetical protein
MKLVTMQLFLIFGLLSINGCSTFEMIGNNHHQWGEVNFLRQSEPLSLNIVQERMQHIRVALTQGEFIKARRLTEMVLLEVQWIEVMRPPQESLRLTTLTQEAINEKKSKKFIT